MDPEQMTVKGGYAVKAQVPVSPHTKDIDVIIMEEQPSKKEQLPRIIRDLLNDRLEQAQVSDHFRFDTGEALGFSDLEPKDVAARVSVRSYIGDSRERFSSFPLDVAVAESHVLPPIIVTAPNHLSWADIDSAQMSVVPPEHLFADKLLIYVESMSQNRIGDIAHMVLLVEQGLDQEKVAAALSRFAEERGMSSRILEPLPEPPEEWAPRFDRIMPEEKNIALEKAFNHISRLHGQLLARGLLGA
ncbi:MAG: nucleotidyl transferase AbiEii/AbiGii toxin family protein [Cyanobacteria bacterium HKST-UBA02]|nr:nucleotidyl transferase AbiEii/AbiGii toxin family protein [Cyanobacteria bacterium HKST-UBA02]